MSGAAAGTAEPDAAVTLEPDGIVHIEYPLHAHVTAAMVRRVLANHQALGDRARPVLISGQRLTGFDREVHEVCNSPEVARLTLAVALVAKTVLERYLMRLYLEFSSSPYPRRAFNDEDEARAWLRGFLAPVPEAAAGGVAG
ncbi:MAG: hypothetical protein KDG50_10300 [Chromatiales bacterium]|nr:hypothetical protein [Chromatiales bacterium]